MLSVQDKKQLKLQIRNNQHEIFVISFDEMDAILQCSFDTHPPGNPINDNKNAWQQLKSKAEFGASYYASADDLVTASKLVGDLGGFTAKAYVKNYGGKPHIILKGYPGLRRILTGTKYGIKNPKVITMGLGKAGAIHAAKSGGIISITLMSTYRVADYVLTDQATLSQLIGSLATDVVKIGIATGASIAAASTIVALGVTVAVGPIMVVLLIGVGASETLNRLDDYYGVTDRVIDGLDEMNSKTVDGFKSIKKDFVGIKKGYTNVKKDFANRGRRLADSAIDYSVDRVKVIIFNMAKHRLDKFLSGKPRIR